MLQALSGGYSDDDLRLGGQTLTKSMVITLCIVTIFGIMMQVNSLDRSFWLDEVWVANAIMEPTVSEMLYYEGWLNTAPPLYLLLVRLATRLFGVSHESMRSVSALFGILSIFAMSYL
jgi:uncharacterized membrane protein